tara:strand:- start:7 stop:438 length:432 start_codon:yes stop_codon:yes gene_type:complete
MNLLYCAIGWSLFFGSIYMNFLKDDKVFNHFMLLLDKEQKKIYFRIIKERVFIYLVGTILGIILAITYNNNYNFNICISLTIIFITQMIIYKIYPKTTYMMYHLKNKAQTDAWMDIYTHMKYNWIKSIGLGLVSYLFILYGIK